MGWQLTSSTINYLVESSAFMLFVQFGSIKVHQCCQYWKTCPLYIVINGVGKHLLCCRLEIFSLLSRIPDRTITEWEWNFLRFRNWWLMHYVDYLLVFLSCSHVLMFKLNASGTSLSDEPILLHIFIPVVQILLLHSVTYLISGSSKNSIFSLYRTRMNSLSPAFLSHRLVVCLFGGSFVIF